MGDFFNWQPRFKDVMKEYMGTPNECLEKYLEEQGFVHKMIIVSANEAEEPTYDEVKEITDDTWTAYWLENKRKIIFMFRSEHDAAAVRLRW